MQAIRTIVKPNERRQVTVDLPIDFLADSVEVIVLPYQQTIVLSAEGASTLTDEQKLLMAFPVATDDDLLFIDEKRQHLNQWK